MLTMLLGGLWHGANWTFLIWGAMHGAALIVDHLWRATRALRAHRRAGLVQGVSTGSSLSTSSVWPGSSSAPPSLDAAIAYLAGLVRRQWRGADRHAARRCADRARRRSPRSPRPTCARRSAPGSTIARPPLQAAIGFRDVLRDPRHGPDGLGAVHLLPVLTAMTPRPEKPKSCASPWRRAIVIYLVLAAGVFAFPAAWSRGSTSATKAAG